jgi:hypothetical protein
MSRQHAAISFDGAQYTLYELNTTNGTYVNSVMMPRNGRRVLRRGSIVSFGGPVAVFRDGVNVRNPFRYRFEPHVDDERALESLPADQLNAAVAAAVVENGGVADAAVADAAVATIASDADVSDALANAVGEAIGAAHPSAADGVAPSRRRSRAALEPQTQIRRSVRQRVPARRYADEQSPPRTAAPAAAPAVVPAVAPPLPPLPTFDPPSVDPLPERSERAIVQRVKDDMQCDICQDLMVAPHIISPCGHFFCGQCITEWFCRKATCPLCRRRCVGSTYVRALDNVIRYVVEPTLDAETNAERDGRRVEWRNMQQRMKMASHQRLLEVRRAGIVAQNAANLNMRVMPVAPMMDRILITGAAPPAAADAVPDAWAVDYAPSGACICYQCIRNIPQAHIRVRRIIMSTRAHADEMAEATESRTRPNEFYHLACLAPRCAVADVRGLEALVEDDRQRIGQAMSAAGAPAGAPAAAE